MAIDIVGHINSEVTSLTTTEKQTMLTKFCEARGYQDEVFDEETGDTIDNPITKKQFMNQDIINYIKMLVNNRIKKDAQEEVTYDEIDIS